LSDPGRGIFVFFIFPVTHPSHIAREGDKMLRCRDVQVQPSYRRRTYCKRPAPPHPSCVQPLHILLSGAVLPHPAPAPHVHIPPVPHLLLVHRHSAYSELAARNCATSWASRSENMDGPCFWNERLSHGCLPINAMSTFSCVQNHAHPAHHLFL
jgi:hypothetical protein